MELMDSFSMSGGCGCESFHVFGWGCFYLNSLEAGAMRGPFKVGWTSNPSVRHCPRFIRLSVKPCFFQQLQVVAGHSFKTTLG